MKPTSQLIFASLLLGAASSQAVFIEISFTSGANSAFAPAFGQFTADNSNPIVTGGTMASPGLEELAELGGGDTLVSERGGTANIFSGPTLFGATNTVTFEVDASTPFFNFAAMLLPSNDWFIGTGARVPTIDISSLLGGSATSITAVFNDLYDAGTEAEDFAFAAPPGAFIPGFTSTPPGGTETTDNISLVDLNNGNPFENFANIPAGFDVSAFDPTGGAIGTLTLTVIPEPSTSLLAGLGALGLLRRRRRA